jgi:hypothetical protein
MSDLNTNTTVSETAAVPGTETAAPQKAPRKPRNLTNTKQSNAAKKAFTMDDKKAVAAERAAAKAKMDAIKAELAAIDDKAKVINAQVGTRRSADGVYATAKLMMFKSECKTNGKALVAATAKAMKVNSVKDTSIRTLANDTRQTLEMMLKAGIKTEAQIKRCIANLSMRATW